MNRPPAMRARRGPFVSVVVLRFEGADEHGLGCLEVLLERRPAVDAPRLKRWARQVAPPPGWGRRTG